MCKQDHQTYYDEIIDDMAEYIRFLIMDTMLTVFQKMLERNDRLNTSNSQHDHTDDF